MSVLKNIIVEYVDGTRHEVPVSKLSKQAQDELSAPGLYGVPLRESSKNYLLLEWKDGWKEVVAVDDQAVELLRYYTIEREEDMGRLSLEMPNASTPGLLVVKRLPGRVKSILLVGGEKVQKYAMEEKATVKEGGKVEHIFYDKKRPDFSMEPGSVASAHYKTMLDSLKAELKKKGLDGSAVLATSEAERIPIYRELARALGFRGSERQQDVYGFLQLAVEELAR